jgi:nucleoside-diphosphate-sugar epimerase
MRIVEWFIDNQPMRKLYNVCTGNVHGLKTLAEKIVAISGKNLEIHTETNDSDREYSGDNSLLLSEMGGFEFNPIDESIRLLYNWYDSNKNLIEEDKL